VWVSPLGRNRAVASAVSLLLGVGLAFGLTQVLGGRAAYLHVGAVLGTIMAANVWRRIIPGQRVMLVQVLERGVPDADLTARTSARSTHNGYMQFPVIFIMISNHYPGLYGHSLDWVVLLLMCVLGAAVRQLLFDSGRSHPAVYGALAVAAVSLVGLTLPVDEKAPEMTAASGQVKVDPARVGRISGAVRLEGVAPPRAELTLTGCSVGHPVLDDAVLVDGNLVQNAFVWIREGAERFEPPPVPDAEVVIDQAGCVYSPRVVGVRAGQNIKFLNSDPVLHNVRSVGAGNPVWNELMPLQGQDLIKVFRRPEVMVQTRCDVHPWMVAHIGVIAHPWFAVTDAKGVFRLEGVPEGEYVVEAWHEVFGKVEARVAVAAGGTAEREFRFRAPR
jgi:plastocyanin